MASQREIRRRIAAVKNIKQITRAMQFVAASKLKRAQDVDARPPRPYSEKIDEVLADLATVLGGEEHPLLAKREGGKRLIVLITSDRGLAGPFNTNTIRFAARRSPSTPATWRSSPSGARAATRCAAPGSRSRPTSRASATGRRSPTSCRWPGSSPTTSSPAKYTRVDIVFSQFVSTLTQRPALDTLLPIEPSEDTEGIPGNQFIFEPDPATVLERLLPRYVATRLFQAVLESKASEESSRMVAMKNATENAEDLIEDYTLAYNKVRQANITREMIEIASGAQAR